MQPEGGGGGALGIQEDLAFDDFVLPYINASALKLFLLPKNYM